MWKHKNFINLQLCAGPQPFPISVNGTMVLIERLSDSMVPGEETWSYNASINTDKYTISGNTVVWSDGTILQYNGVDVVPTDNIVFNGQYTTRSATPTLTFKHFYDAGTIGSGTVKFRHYSQQEPSSGETWVLNDSLTDTTGETGFLVKVNFTSNSAAFTKITLRTRVGREGVQIDYDTTTVYDSLRGSGWLDQAYRTITFDEPVTDTILLTWLQANGVKQGGGGQ